MGYGKRALKLPKSYYAGQFTLLSENYLSGDEGGFQEIDNEDVRLLKESITPSKKFQHFSSDYQNDDRRN